VRTRELNGGLSTTFCPSAWTKSNTLSAPAKSRRPHNRLGFAYQVAFVRLFDRFPQEQPFELLEELVCFSAAQLGLDAGLIELYCKRPPTISEHRQTIADYLRLRPFDDAAVTQLEQFLFEEACRLKQAAALTSSSSRAREIGLKKPARAPSI
jgi:hypothetical protein